MADSAAVKMEIKQAAQMAANHAAQMAYPPAQNVYAPRRRTSSRRRNTSSCRRRWPTPFTWPSRRRSRSFARTASAAFALVSPTRSSRRSCSSTRGCTTS
eukprot:6200886-Pleurochrysis_carterae.AAC.3